MNVVQKLPLEVAERIAAGEVVDRPVSIAKELIENSLDASSTFIEVELQEGGRQLIRVSDNGLGMSPDDARLSVERHATSKIRLWEDLDSLYTFGFRGEALPSIAAVSRFELLTTARGEAVGTRVSMEGPLSAKFEPAAGPQGTRIDVRDLFWNTPARRKFLKSPAAETIQVTELVTKFAILNPGVGFRLTVNGKEKLFIAEQSSLAQRLAKYWKLDQDDLIEVSQTVGEIEVAGVIAKPAHHRRNRTAQLIAVNGRIIHSQTLSQAFVEGYDPLLPRGRHPYCFVNLSLDPAAVDVNIHPTKAEVRFADSRAPFRAIYRTLKNRLDAEKVETLKENQWSSALSGDTSQNQEPGIFDSVMPPVLIAGKVSKEPSPASFTAPRATAKPTTDRVMELYRPPDRSIDQEPATEFLAESAEEAPSEPEVAPESPQHDRPTQADQGELYTPDPSAPPRIEYLTRLYGAYLVARVDDQLWVVDQHAAHERISYERLHRFQITGPDSQGLVVPFPLTLNPQDRDYLEMHKDRFKEIGFDFTDQDDEICLCAVPPGLPGRQVETFFHELLAEMSDQVPSVNRTPVAQYREKLRAMMACKSSIRAREKITADEAIRLIEDLLTAERSPYCPHGRPTRIRLDEKTLERLFHRS